MIYLILIFLVLCALIWYPPMIPVSTLFSLTVVAHQSFANMVCMVLFMLLLLRLVLSSVVS
jgi:hypothetical protein